MVREAYSAGGQPQQAESGAAAQPLDVSENTANLTQELSLLLAQSIAQGQSGNRVQSTGAAGSELANLAALVSASQNQRNLQPSFKDGLSSLSYARPPQQPLPPSPAPTAVIAQTGGGLLVSEPHDEEPMPIPSTWRQPAPSDDDRWYRQQLGAAGLGLLAGLVVVVPAVLWLSGWIGGAPTKTAAARHQPATEAAPAPVAQVPQVKVRIATASTEPGIPATPERRITVAAAPPVEPAPTPRSRPLPERLPVAVVPAPRVEPAPVRLRAEELLAQAKRLIENKDVLGARQILKATETSSSGALMFMLAETYDPSMLAIWQVKPENVTANPQRARALYIRARDLGDARAQQRLEWLR